MAKVRVAGISILPSDIRDALRRLVERRAFYDYEYSLLSEDDSFSPHQFDRIIRLIRR